ncbi:MAG: hypothetical protein ACE5ER_10800 [Nitrospinaceae bacterium]
MSDDKKQDNKEPPINEKFLAYSIIGILGVGFISILFVAVPWLLHGSEVTWKEYLMEDFIILLAILMFVFGFYNNTKLH